MIKKLKELLQSVLRPTATSSLEQFIIAHRPQSMFEVESLQRKYYQYYQERGL